MQNYVVDSGKLKEYTTKLFLAAGLAQTDAQAVSELLVHADLRNVRSHGVLRTVPYLEKIQKGGASKTSAYPVQSSPFWRRCRYLLNIGHSHQYHTANPSQHFLQHFCLSFCQPHSLFFTTYLQPPFYF